MNATGHKGVDVIARVPHPNARATLRQECLREKRKLLNEAFALLYG